MGVAFQRVPAGHVVVSCDNDVEEIAAVVRGCSEEFARPIAIVQRANMGECRVGQARNNGFKGLRALGAGEKDRTLYFDGDCCPGAEVTWVHQKRGERAELLVGFRVEMTPEQTEAFDESAVRDHRVPAEPTLEQLKGLENRDGRYRRQLLLRRFGLAKAHKPKLLSAHFSVTVEAMGKVNGFDEEFKGWGQEDDDLGRRLHASGASAGIVVKEAMVFHQWHPTRAPGEWKASAGVERFHRRLPWRCARGIEHPLEQGEVVLRVFEGGREVLGRTLAESTAVKAGTEPAAVRA